MGINIGLGRAFLNACTWCYVMEVVSLCDIGGGGENSTHVKGSVNNGKRV